MCVGGGDKQIAVLWTKLDTGNALLGYFDLKLSFCGDVGGLRERRLVTRNTHPQLRFVIFVTASKYLESCRERLFLSPKK